MTPRDRVLKFLARETPDRVPWTEAGIDQDLQVRIMGRPDFEPAELCRKLGLDAFGWRSPRRSSSPSGAPAVPGNHDDYYFPDYVNFDFRPPWIAEMGAADAAGRSYVKKGLLTSRESLRLFDTFLPDPDHPARYETVARWIGDYRQEFAVFARLRLGASPMLESMGLDVFSYMLYDDPGLVHEIHRRFAEWSARVVRHLNEMDFDFYWFSDDLAANSGPFMSPKAFREFFLPHMETVVREVKRPWIFHSDGDLTPILPDLLSLGMSAIHPLQPSVMDIVKVKQEWGGRVGLVGNIDLDYTLTRGTPEDVESEVKLRIETVGPGGGYMISSANSLPDYCRPENVLAMARAVEKYGYYPVS